MFLCLSWIHIGSLVEALTIQGVNSIDSVGKIIHLFKRKGNPQVCENHRGISLLLIAGKIFARALLNWTDSSIHDTLTYCPCEYQVSTLLPLQFLRKVPQKQKKNHKWQIVNPTFSKSYRPLALILITTIQQSTVHVCTKFQLYSFRSSWEICNDFFFHLWKIVKPVKGNNSKNWPWF